MPKSTLGLDRGLLRIQALATLVNSIGNGIFSTCATLYFTEVVHISLIQVGLGVTCASIPGILVGIPVGHLADRHGPREVCIVASFFQCATIGSLIFAHDFTIFVVLVSLDRIASSAANSSRAPLIRAITGDRAVAFRATLRSIGSAGYALGAGIAGITIAVGTHTAFTVAILLDSLSFLIVVVILTRIPYCAPVVVAQKAGSRWTVFSDRPYIIVAALNGLMSIQYLVLSVPLPLWIVLHTNAPRWAVAASVLINTVLCVFLQRRNGAKVDTVRTSGTAMRRAGLIFLLSCPMLAFAAGLSAWLSLSLILAAVAVHTLGEIYHASASFMLSLDLAPAHAQGQYQGMFASLQQITSSLGPTVLIFLCLTMGRAGWIALGVFFALTGIVTEFFLRWAVNDRHEIDSEAVGKQVSSPITAL